MLRRFVSLRPLATAALAGGMFFMALPQLPAGAAVPTTPTVVVTTGIGTATVTVTYGAGGVAATSMSASVSNPFVDTTNDNWYPICSALRTGSEASTSCTISLQPGQYSFVGTARGTGGGSDAAAQTVTVPGPPAAPHALTSQYGGSFVAGQYGAVAEPWAPGYTSVHMTFTRFAKQSGLTPVEPTIQPMYGQPSFSTAYAFDPKSSAVYYQCEMGLNFHRGFLMKSTSLAKANCYFTTGDNLKLADVGSSANQVSSTLGGMAMDTNGLVHVSDTGNNRIQVWNGTALSTEFGTGTAGSGLNQVNKPGQVAVDATGTYLYVADAGNNRVLRFTVGGSSSGTVVAGGNGAGNNLNQLSNPLGVTVDGSGNVYVADTDNCRLVKWAPNASSGTLLLGKYGCLSGADYNSGSILPGASGAMYGGPGTAQVFYNALQNRVYVNAPGALYSGYYDLTSNSYIQILSPSGRTNFGIGGRDSTGTPGGWMAMVPDGRVAWTNYSNQLVFGNFSGERYYCDVSLSTYATSTAGKLLTQCSGSAASADDTYSLDAYFTNSYGEGVHTTLYWVDYYPWTSAPASPGKPTAAPSYKGVKVSWTHATTGQSAAGYTVTVQPGGGTCTAKGNETNCTVTGLTVGTKYTATVVATNPRGSSTATAKSNEAIPYDLPGTMKAPTAKPMANGSLVSFVAPTTGGQVRSYTVTASPGGASCNVDAPATNCLVPGLTAGTAYTFTVAASNEGGAGPSSPSSASVTPFDIPSQPGKPTLTAGDGGVVVKGSTSSSDGGSAITGYTATIYDGDGNAVGSCNYVDASIGCSVPGLPNGVTYTAKVVAHNAGGSSDPSAASDGATPSGPPGQPGNISVTPGDGTLDFSWDPPESNGGTSITGYTVGLFPGDGTCTVDAVAHTAHCSGLTNGTSYSTSVFATNGSGGGSGTAPISATPTTVPGVPATPTIKAANGSVTVTWKAPASNGGSPITSYTVTVGGKTCVVTKLTCTITGLPNGTPVTATVSATNAAGSSANSSASASATPSAPAGTLGAPPFPPNVTAGDGGVTASFDGPPGAGAKGMVFIAQPGGLSCTATKAPFSCKIAGLENGTEYTVVAAYVNAKGVGAVTDASDPVTPVGAPMAPQQVTATGTNGVMAIKWAPPLSDGGSTITSYTATVLDSKGKAAGTCTYTVASPEADTCTVSGLSTSEVYSVQVFATNAKGNGAKATLSDVLVSLAFNSLTAPKSTLQVAVGDKGQIYRSVDGGAHWAIDATPTLANLNGVGCGGGGTFCMAVGDNGTILTWDAATDTGSGVKTWKTLDASTSTKFNGVFCINDGACIVVGDGSTIAISDPVAGKAAPSTIKVNDVSEVFPGNVNAITCTNPKAPAKPACVIGGDGGKLVAVKWGGTSSGFGQPALLSVTGVTSDITALRCSADTNCVAVGKSGLVVSGTKDITVAKDWKKIGTIKGFDATKDLRGVACPALSQLCMAVGNGGSILISTPKKPAGPGTTGWAPLNAKVSYDLTKVRCISQTACLGIGGGHLLQVVQDKAGKWVVRQVA